MEGDISAGYLCTMKVWAVQALVVANDTSGNSSFSKNWKLRRDLPHCDTVSFITVCTAESQISCLYICGLDSLSPKKENGS